MSDQTLFTIVKARYFEETSRLRRFFALKGVKKISYVKVCISHSVIFSLQMEIEDTSSLDHGSIETLISVPPASRRLQKRHC